jgi:uncharacterized Rossmann fold enzyme
MGINTEASILQRERSLSSETQDKITVLHFHGNYLQRLRTSIHNIRRTGVAMMLITNCKSITKVNFE